MQLSVAGERSGTVNDDLFVAIDAGDEPLEGPTHSGLPEPFGAGTDSGADKVSCHPEDCAGQPTGEDVGDCPDDPRAFTNLASMPCRCFATVPSANHLMMRLTEQGHGRVYFRHRKDALNPIRGSTGPVGHESHGGGKRGAKRRWVQRFDGLQQH